MGGPIYPSSCCCQHTLRSTFQRSRGIISKGWHLFFLERPFPPAELSLPHDCVAPSPHSLAALTQAAPPEGPPLLTPGSIILLSLRGYHHTYPSGYPYGVHHHSPLPGTSTEGINHILNCFPRRNHASYSSMERSLPLPPPRLLLSPSAALPSPRETLRKERIIRRLHPPVSHCRHVSLAHHPRTRRAPFGQQLPENFIHRPHSFVTRCSVSTLHLVIVGHRQSFPLLATTWI